MCKEHNLKRDIFQYMENISLFALWLSKKLVHKVLILKKERKMGKVICAGNQKGIEKKQASARPGDDKIYRKIRPDEDEFLKDFFYEA